MHPYRVYQQFYYSNANYGVGHVRSFIQLYDFQFSGARYSPLGLYLYVILCVKCLQSSVFSPSLPHDSLQEWSRFDKCGFVIVSRPR